MPPQTALAYPRTYGIDYVDGPPYSDSVFALSSTCMTQSTYRTAPEWLVWAALLTVYVVWGSTYLAIAVTVRDLPPLLAGATRFAIAGLIVVAALGLRHGPGAVRLSRAEIAGSALVGVALLTGGNGMVMLGQREVPSGLAALIVAIVPLWVIVLRLAFREQIRWGTLAGVLVGFAGVAVLVVPRGLEGSVDMASMLMLVAAGASWALGSYYSRRLALPSNPFLSTGAQMIAGAIGLAALGVVSGELGHRGPAAGTSSESIVALAYLVVFGSLVGFTAYTWLLQHAPVSKVATYAYVNPVVAIALGTLVLGEPIGLTMIVGGAMIVVAVGLVIRTEARPRVDAGALDAPPAQSALAKASPEDTGDGAERSAGAAVSRSG
jgi:drug/metabolite transporter (DMT)-like permease